MQLNNVIIGGHLTRDPEIRYTPKGTAVADASLAVNEVWNDEQGRKHEEVSFIDFEAFGKSAEVLGEYLHKGDPLIITGRLKQDRWEDNQTGQNKSKLKVIVQKLTLLPRAKADGQQNSTSSQTKRETPPPQQRRPEPPLDPELEPDLDEIPF